MPKVTVPAQAAHYSRLRCAFDGRNGARLFWLLKTQK
jgi:hypothetical protein